MEDVPIPKRLNPLTGEWEQITFYQQRILKLIRSGVLSDPEYKNVVLNNTDDWLASEFIDPCNLAILEGDESSINYIFDTYDKKMLRAWLVELLRKWPTKLNTPDLLISWAKWIEYYYNLDEIETLLLELSDIAKDYKTRMQRKIKHVARIKEQADRIRIRCKQVRNRL